MICSVRKYLVVASAIVAICGLSAFAADSKGTNAPAGPPSFPKVNLSRNSNPRYCSVNLDSLQSQVAYLLFDGDVTNGYKRVFVWCPDHPKFGKEPKSYLHDEQTGTYRPIKTESVVGKQGSETTWTMQYRAEYTGHTYTDYKTGKTITTERRLVPRFWFNVDLLRGPARRADRAGGRYPLDISMKGRLPVSDSWEKLPELLQPWENVFCVMSRTPVYDKNRGYLRCKAHLRFHLSRHNAFPVTVRNLPDDSKVHMEIAPYLKETSYKRDFVMEEIFMNHFDVELPYGWYRIQWEFISEFFNARNMGGSSDSWPFPFSPPSPD